MLDNKYEANQHIQSARKFVRENRDDVSKSYLVYIINNLLRLIEEKDRSIAFVLEKEKQANMKAARVRG